MITAQILQSPVPVPLRNNPMMERATTKSQAHIQVRDPVILIAHSSQVFNSYLLFRVSYFRFLFDKLDFEDFLACENVQKKFVLSMTFVFSLSISLGLSSVVQLSKEALQAIEQAGNDCGGGKRGGPRLNYEELDPKRRKFLERNRQAAARCRERKKQWIVSLEGRSNVSFLFSDFPQELL